MKDQTAPSEFLQELTLRVCEACNSPRGVTVAILLRYGEWVQLANLRAEPDAYLTADHYRRAVVPTDLLRKCRALPTGIHTEAVAWVAFQNSELRCKKTNERLGRLINNAKDNFFVHHEDLRFWEFLLKVKKRVASIVGSLPSDLDIRFGPGATVGVPSRACTVPDKMSQSPTATESMKCLETHWSSTAWSRGLMADYGGYGCGLSVVRGGEFFTVPKDATTDRGCETQPTLNGAYQLGTGKYLKRKLKDAGLDLSRGKEIHMRVACEASITGRHATVDLKNASDLVSKALVDFLFPECWADWLNTLRAPLIRTPGKGPYRRLEKFSGMGNGFTFELETIIFAAIAAESMIASGVTPELGGNLWVFGDDIIVPTECARNVLSALRLCGFVPNERKTFVEGNFRESCGGDFFNGCAVRPIYIEDDPSEPQEFISLANALRRLLDPNDPNGDFSRGIRRAWFLVLDQLPSNVRECRGPEELGDIVIHDEPEKWSTRTRYGVQSIRVYRPIALTRIRWQWGYGAQLASALYGTCITTEQRVVGPDKELLTRDFVVPRNPTLGFTCSWIPYFKREVRDSTVLGRLDGLFGT